MKKVLLTVFAVIFYAPSFSQTKTIDSLKQLLKDERTDTGRVQLLTQLAILLLDSRPDTTMKVALQALELSQRINYEKGEALSLNRIGNAYSTLGNYPKAMKAFLEALKINEKIHNLDGLHRNLNNIGVIYASQGEYRQSMNYYNKAREIGERENYKELQSTVLNGMAESYLALEVYDSALLFAQQSYALANKVGYSRESGGSLKTLGAIYFLMGKNNLALEYYRSALPYTVDAESYTYMAEVFLNMAKVYERLGQSDSVRIYARQSLDLAKRRGFALPMREAASFLSLFYRKRNADSAFFYQDVLNAANDSFFSQKKQRDLSVLAFEEGQRQQEIKTKTTRDENERRENIQFAVIALGLISFLIFFFLLSHSIIANQKLIKFLGVLALLIVFEFINLLIHPYLGELTHHSPLLMLSIMVCIAALLIPLHHKLEHWITHKLVEKNNRIRLNAARKTIAELDENNSETQAGLPTHNSSFQK